MLKKTALRETFHEDGFFVVPRFKAAIYVKLVLLESIDIFQVMPVTKDQLEICTMCIVTVRSVLHEIRRDFSCSTLELLANLFTVLFSSK